MEAMAVQPLSAQLAELRNVEPQSSSSQAYVGLMAHVLNTLDDGHLVPYLRNSPSKSVVVHLNPDVPLQYMFRGDVYEGDRLRLVWPERPDGTTAVQVGRRQNSTNYWSLPMTAHDLERNVHYISALNTPEELASGFADLTEAVVDVLDEQMEREATLWMENRVVEP